MSRSAALAEPMLNPEDEQRLIRAWKENGDQLARDKIVRAYARLCYKIASNYSSNPDHIEDLAQEGGLGILRALDKYDPTRGVKFSTYSRFWVQNFVAAATAGTVSVVSVPARAFIDARMGRIPEGKNDAAIMAALPVLNLDAPLAEDGNLSLIDMMVCPLPNPEETVASVRKDDYVRKLIFDALSTLSHREREVVLLRRLNDPPQTLEEIARIFGVTRERIRQIEVAATAKLADRIKSGGVDPATLFGG